MDTPTTRAEILRFELVGHYHGNSYHEPVTLDRLPDGRYVLAVETPNDERFKALAAEGRDDEYRGDLIDLPLTDEQVAKMLTTAGVPEPPDTEPANETTATEHEFRPETGMLILNGRKSPSLVDFAFKFYGNEETMRLTRGEIVLRRQDASRGNLGWLAPQVIELPAEIADSLSRELHNMPEGWSGCR